MPCLEVSSADVVFGSWPDVSVTPDLGLGHLEHVLEPSVLLEIEEEEEEEE